ncbi:DUF1592 domain-containing protein [Planctomycetaceae bacterium SH139]
MPSESPAPNASAAAASFAELEQQYLTIIRPLLQSYCLDCHSSASAEGELDLEKLDGLRTLREHPTIWKQVTAQLEIAEMPPADSPQPSPTEIQQLIDWSERFLRAEAYAAVDEPGPVVVRRLSNAEYTNTLRELTKLPSLQPTVGFPSDGAAGEGFSNAAAALVMSPALLDKYLDAAKQVAEHAVLLPHGIRFSESTSRRDWSQEILSQIRDYYARYSTSGQQRELSLQEVQVELQDAGVIPLAAYFAVTVHERECLQQDPAVLSSLAKTHNLNERYLRLLWQRLNTPSASPLITQLRQLWQQAKPGEQQSLVEFVRRWQGQLWQFGAVGHIGKVGGPQAWQSPISPIVTSQQIDIPFSDEPGSHTGQVKRAAISISAKPFDNEDAAPLLELTDARVALRNQQIIQLDQADAIAAWSQSASERELARTVDYLRALEQSARQQLPIARLAEQRDLLPALLQRWSRISGIGGAVDVEPTNLFTNRLENIGGYPAIRGWGSQQTPSVIVNTSDDQLQFSTLTVPARSVCVHPSPNFEVYTSWRCPADCQIEINGLVADADGNCGNGFEWRLEILRNSGVSVVATGDVDNGGQAEFAPQDSYQMLGGELIRLVINPRQKEHACDTTYVELEIKGVGSSTRAWRLSTAAVKRIEHGNPISDDYGHKSVWYFGSSPVDPPKPVAIIAGSLLERWRDRLLAGAPSEELRTLAEQITELLTNETKPVESAGAADQQLKNMLRDWLGPLEWTRMAAEEISGTSTQPRLAKSTLTNQGQPFTIELPPGLATGASFRATARLLSEDASACQIIVNQPASGPLVAGPILVADRKPAQEKLEAQLQTFRDLFPAALCYSKIVPVDEVVTLRLYYREDEHLNRLMLSEQEASELDRLWEELWFVSREPLKLVDVYEQLWQYATQDADPSAFEPLRQPILARAEKFRQQLLDVEPLHVEAVVNFAERAWRRPLTVSEQTELGSLYERLKTQGLDHEAAIRMLITRILVAADFIFKLEISPQSAEPKLLSNYEIATRLSYFLWASQPDEPLRALADQKDSVLAAADDLMVDQLKRMQRAPEIRQLAIEFGCQWLGVKDFDQFDEKNEKLFPEFSQLRTAMYEETVRFWTDFFQHDRSVLSLLDADHTFVNQELADFYGLQPPADNTWERVEGLRELGRGGILGMATTLAKQSGASRTSPILRGNWVYESLLGNHLPNPPVGVPQLPETVPAGLTSRELIELHSEQPACARCHQRIDPYGFALEQFDAIGTAREPADTQASLPDGKQIEGLSGLRAYLLTVQREQFMRQFCRKLLGYALGRRVLLTDEPLLDKMVASLQARDHKVSAALETIVLSPQFRLIRGQQTVER